MPEKVELVKASGESLKVDLISMFSVNNKEYILVTANEIDQNGLIKIHVAEILGNKIIKVANEEEWGAVKNVMRSIISSSEGTFTYTNRKGPFNVDDDFSRVIAVQDSAKMQLVNDYNSKKPALVEEKKEVSEVKEDSVVPLIYPTDATNNNVIGEEVVPGIIDDAPVAPQDEVVKPIKIETKPVEPVAPVAPVASTEAPTFDANTIAPDNNPSPAVANVNTNNNSAVNPVNKEVTVEAKPAAPVKEAPVAPETNIFDNVPKVENAPSSTTKPVSESIKKDETKKQEMPTNSDALKEELFGKIKAAVDEYIAKVGSETNNSAEVDALKNELEEKNKKLNDIMGLLNLKD